MKKIPARINKARKTNVQSEGESNMRKVKLLLGFLILTGAILWCFHIEPANATYRMKEKGTTEEKAFISTAKLAEPINVQQRVHRVGLMRLCVTNWGFFGSQGRALKESKGGCYNPYPDKEVAAPSCEYPAGSDIDYLFQGGLWIGAMVNDTPYVSLACDGWFWIYEMWPDAGEAGAIREKSTRPNTSC